MKRPSILRQSAVSILVCFAVIGIGIWAGTMQGCGSVQVRPVQDPAVINAVLQEAGFAAFYYGLRKQDAEKLQMGADAIRGCRILMDTKEPMPNTIIPRLAARLQEIAGLDDETTVLISRSLNLLYALVQVDISIPENYQAAMQGLAEFLTGAEEGLQAAKASGQRSEVRDQKIAFDLVAFESDLVATLAASRSEFQHRFPPPMPARYGRDMF